jgi:predicted nucleotidyltransferase
LDFSNYLLKRRHLSGHICSCSRLAKTIKNIQGLVAKYSQIDRAIFYGSRTKGNNCNGSNVDLAAYHQIENQELVEHIDWVGVVFSENLK